MRAPKNLPTPRMLVYLTLVIVVPGCLPVLIYARQFVQPLSLEELEQKALAAAQNSVYRVSQPLRLRSRPRWKNGTRSMIRT